MQNALRRSHANGVFGLQWTIDWMSPTIQICVVERASFAPIPIRCGPFKVGAMCVCFCFNFQIQLFEACNEFSAIICLWQLNGKHHVKNCERQTETKTKTEFTDKIRKLEKWKIVEWEWKIFVLFEFFFLLLSSCAGTCAAVTASIVTVMLCVDVDVDDRVKDIGQQMSQTTISPLSWLKHAKCEHNVSTK